MTAVAGAIVGVTAARILLREDRRSGWTLAKRIIALVVLALVLAVVGPTLVTLFGHDLTLSGPTDIWRLSWDMFAAHPLIGLGEGSADALLTPLLQKNLFPAAVDAHSGYLDRLVEVGIIGLTLLLGACFLALRRAMFGDTGNPQLRLGNRAFAACIIVALTQALGEIGPFRVYGRGFVLFYAIVCISVRAASRTRNWQCA